ncbi:YkgJ family cysteine cluster protein [bacterium]|nr:YkgJ family cysteine cluster protein [bacterium]
MAKLRLPPGIRYTCIRCGQCCRTLEVTLTDDEHARLAAHDWCAEQPDLTAARLFARFRRPRGRQTVRLRPLPSGACRLLAEEGLCRVHATLGLQAKPFAGRLFPFVFRRTPVGVFVGVRFNCPAVVRGEGTPLEEQRGDLQRLFAEYVGTYSPPMAAERVRFFGRYEMGWPDILRIEDEFLGFLAAQDLDVPRRLLACRRLARQFVGGAVSRGDDAAVGASPEAILAALRQGTAEMRGLSRMERTMVRLLVATFLGARLPSFRERTLLGRSLVRLRNVGLRLQMAAVAGRCRLPELDAPVPIRAVGHVDVAHLDAASAAMLERYFTAKIASQGFFGLAFFGRSFVEGLDCLVAAYGAILWLAGARAAAGGRDQVDASDVEYGIRHVDYGFNFLGQFGGTLDRVRSVLFWHWETPEKLMAALSSDLPPTS